MAFNDYKWKGGTGRKFPPTMAVLIMLEAEFRPLVPYPDSNMIGWKSQCQRCGKTSYPRFSNVRTRGHCCIHCSGQAPISAEEAAANVAENSFTLLGEFMGTQEKSLARHEKCGAEDWFYYKSMVREDNNGYCGHCMSNRKQTEDDAYATLRELQWTALEPYPDSTQIKWLIKCNICGYEIRKSVSHLRSFYKKNPDWRGCKPCGVTKRTAERRSAVNGTPWKEGSDCIRENCPVPAHTGGMCESDYVMTRQRARKGVTEPLGRVPDDMRARRLKKLESI